MIPDQKNMWDKKHSQGDHKSHRGKPTQFSFVAKKYFKDSSKILELGCGVGSDSVAFADEGFQVEATDFSSEVIKQNMQEFNNSSVNFSALDMSNPLPYAESTFDVVYSHLSLHYYNDSTTRKIISEIYRVLKQGGILAFACKSTKDPHYGEGLQIETDVFVSPKGHIRHLFSIEYSEVLLKDLFEIVELEEVEGQYNNDKSVFIYCIARKDWV